MMVNDREYRLGHTVTSRDFIKFYKKKRVCDRVSRHLFIESGFWSWDFLWAKAGTVLKIDGC